jgi:Fe-S-cluster containining protein
MDSRARKTVIQHFRQVYLEADKAMFLLNPFCVKGCAWCCYQSVEMLNWEGPILTDYLQRHKNDVVFSKVYKNLLTWFGFFDATFPKNELTMHDAFDYLHNQQARQKIPCPFLVENYCAIYPVRPLCCRCHIAVENNHSCKANPLNDSEPEAEAYREKVVNDIVNNVPTTLRLLPFVAAPFFGLENRIKPIHYTRLLPVND